MVVRCVRDSILDTAVTYQSGHRFEYSIGEFVRLVNDQAVLTTIISSFQIVEDLAVEVERKRFVRINWDARHHLQVSRLYQYFD